MFALDFLLHYPMHVGAVSFATSLTLIVYVYVYSFCLACTSRIGTWFPCSLALMSVVFFRPSSRFSALVALHTS